MPYDTLLARNILTFDERLCYYACDLNAAGETIEVLRTEKITDDSTDSVLRMVILALASVAHSLEREADTIRAERREQT